MNDNKYCNYLKTRSKLAYLYRKLFLYPRIIKRTKGKILDYGCGIGDFLSVAPNSTGVDINKSCVDYCNEQSLSAFHILDSTIPFPDGTFDTVILDNVYEHIPNPKMIIPEIKRTLSKDGILIIGVPGKKGYRCDDTHVNYYYEENLEASLKQFGFTKKKFFYTPLFKSSLLSEKIKTYTLWGEFLKNG